jgi:hypothetical protein
MVTATAIEIIKQNVKDQLATMEEFENAPKESEFIHWAYSHLCNKKDMKEEDRRRPVPSVSCGASALERVLVNQLLLSLKN